LNVTRFRASGVGEQRLEAQRLNASPAFMASGTPHGDAGWRAAPQLAQILDVVV
jgi:hypothetical protein